MKKKLAFKKSSLGSIGTELEFQIIQPGSFSLISRAKDLIRNIATSDFATRIKPEITQSMIEINSSIHHSPKKMYAELLEIQKYLIKHADILGVNFCGGGTHPFQEWSTQKIFPIKRYKDLTHQYKFLSKRSTVFGQHIHVGCPSGEDAIYLTHALARYSPHFMAISASSPFYLGIDTGFLSSRSTIFSTLPLTGVAPLVNSWEEFSQYFLKMRHYKIIQSMKDFYWDTRPKPTFGTVEIRVCDTPLRLEKAIQIVAYIQALSIYLLDKRPVQINRDLYDVYNYNRFQACRFGFDGCLIDSMTKQTKTISDDILETIKTIEKYIIQLNTQNIIKQLTKDVINKKNDALLLKNLYKKFDSFPKVVAEQCKLWKLGDR